MGASCEYFPRVALISSSVPAGDCGGESVLTPPSEIVMLKEVTGIRRVRMLYVQLQYGCNFRCKH